MKKGKDKYRLLKENMMDGYAYHQIVRDSAGTPVDYIFLDVNQAFEAITGLARDDILGKTATEVLPGMKESGFDWMGTYGQVAITGKPVRFESYSEPLNRWYEVSAYSGEYGYFVAIFRDITEAKRAHETLVISEARYRRLFESAKDRILILDAETGKIITVNPFLVQLLGYPEKEILGKTIWEIGTFKDIVANQDKFLELQQKGYIRYENLPLQTAEGRQVAVEFVSNVYLEGQHKVIQCNIRDITERKRSELFQNLSGEVLAILNESGNFYDSMQRILSTMKLKSGFDAVGIRLQSGDDFPYYVQDGFSDDFLRVENSLVARDPNGDICRNFDGSISLECTCGLIISGKTDPSNPLFTPGGSCWTNDSFPLLELPSSDDPRLHPRNQCIHQGFASVAMLPICKKQQIMGILQLNDRRKGQFNLDMINALEGIASHIGEALMRKQAEDALHRIEWMLDPEKAEIDEGLSARSDPPYGNLTQLNTSRFILDSLGEDILADIAKDYLALLDTSSAVYEKNGDYAMGIFSSGWCRFLDLASRQLCQTDDNRVALQSGKWLCHESCWTDTSRVAIETSEPVDRPCHGGLRLYAAPIWASNEVVGVINFGYGDPPQEPEELQWIATKYAVDPEELQTYARDYESRPPFIIELAKERLHSSARLIGALLERKQAEQKLADYTQELEQLYRYLDQELSKAQQVHEQTLPQSLPAIENLSFAAYYQPAAKMGGDFYDVIHRGNKLIFYLSDVSGHGLDGAMLSLFVKHTINSYIDLTPAENITPQTILNYLAEKFYQETFPEELFIAIFLAVLDLETMELTYCAAGFQETPLVRLGSGEQLELVSKGFVISQFFPVDALNFEEDRVKLSPGSTLFFTTDGLTEQGSPGAYYMDRLRRIFYKNAHLPPELIKQAVVEDFRHFNGGSMQGDDDITFLILQVEKASS